MNLLEKEQDAISLPSFSPQEKCWIGSTEFNSIIISDLNTVLNYVLKSSSIKPRIKKKLLQKGYWSSKYLSIEWNPEKVREMNIPPACLVSEGAFVIH